jgi:hypothetical protein
MKTQAYGPNGRHRSFHTHEIREAPIHWIWAKWMSTEQEVDLLDVGIGTGTLIIYDI